ncbi:hypothetical protein [Domibacillus aminovorans]|uniref:Uncharacterized protein n=1 Tax=Domibacillus aminovorans TaxID=29332 RepID=A0A177L5T4_9BACI|nr:hypothetical protein [Domibacillus aminovorans]OAH60111.1 hypothetical protein AWH49_18070 [Domibacillus aminovorans]
MTDDKETLGFRANKNKIITRFVYFCLFTIIVVGIRKPIDMEPSAFFSKNRSDIEQQSASIPKSSDVKEHEPVSSPGAFNVLGAFQSAGLAVPEPKDNTISCIKFGCVQLVITEVVSIYEWPDVATAKETLANGIADYQAGSFTIHFSESYNSDGSIKCLPSPSKEAYIKQLDKFIQ